MTGSIPSQFFQLTKLQLLNSFGKGLEGTLPSAIGNLKDLAMLDVGFNKLTGTIPSQLYGLTKLRFLNFHGNAFTGALSSGIGRLSDMEILILLENNLSGAVPSELALMTDLLMFVVIENPLLTGNVSSAVCDAPQILLMMDCTDTLCGCNNCTCSED